VKHPKIREEERYNELKNKIKNQYFCSRCGKELTKDNIKEIDRYGVIWGRCLHKSKGGCQRKTILVTKEEMDKIRNEGFTPSTTSTTSTTSTDNIIKSGIDYHTKGLLIKERKPYMSIGRGVHNGVFYIGTALQKGDKLLDAVITSDRKIYVDWASKNELNEIKNYFGLNYRFNLFADCLDYWWSNSSILKWLEQGYTVDIKEIFNKIVEKNRKFMIYEDDRIHKYTALDIMRSYFFILFLANSRTHHLAEPDSGKTNQHMIYRALSFNPMSSTDFSSASIYRFIESASGTILIDDFDLLPEDQKNAIIQHIRTNYKKFKTVRADGNKSNRPYGYNSYSHLIFNNVYGLGNDRITPQRVITIRILKHSEAKNITVDPDAEFWKPIRDDLYIMTLQYWKNVKNIYNALKVDELTTRELELIKPILSIAKLIDDELYNGILEWYIELVKQEKIRDITDDWEFLLLKELWDIVKDKEPKEEIRVFVKKIALNIADKITSKSNENYKTKLSQLYAFVGGKLKGYLFKGGFTNGRTRYDIYKERVEQQLEVKGLFELVEAVDVVDVKEPPIDLFINGDKPQYEKINDLKDFILTEKKANRKIWYESLKSKFPENFISHCIESGLLVRLPNNEYDFGG
jgi:hypothetical protein